MVILEESNWKYDIPFDNQVYIKAKKFANQLPKQQKEIYDFMINFYRKNFSLQQILDILNLIKNENIMSFKSAVLKRKEHILFMPQCLKSHYEHIIKIKYNDHAPFLNELLSVALEKEQNTNLLLPLYRQMFGSYFKKLKKTFKHKSKKHIALLKVDKLKSSPQVETQGIFDYLEKDYLTQGIFGKTSFKDIDIMYNNEYGIGEIHNKKVSPVIKDIFVVNTNDNKITKSQLERSIYYNVYPGKSHFYNNVLKPSSQFVDLGATFMIDGWSQFVAWHTNNNLYTKNEKIIACYVLNKLLKNNFSKAINQIYIYLLSKYTKQQTLDIIIELTQYLGRYESRALGSYAVEFLIDYSWADSPTDLLKKLSSQNVCDVFATLTK